MDPNIGINKEDRTKVGEGLGRLLADTFMLYLKTHNFHWNVRGPQFNSLHVMFENQYNELWTALDEIAERIRALGVDAPGTLTQFTALTKIQETEGVPKATEMIRILVEDHEKVIATANELFPDTEKAGDEPTGDMLISRMQIHEKTAWMLRSLLE